MIKFESGIFDGARVFSNLLMIILVAGNIFFSIQYTENIRQQAATDAATSATSVARVQAAHFLNLFISTVLNPSGATVSIDDRIKLEDQVHQLGSPAIVSQWNTFVASKDAVTAQKAAVKLMAMVTATML